MSFNQPVNLLNEKELNQFLAKIVYSDEEVDFFDTSDFRDISFVKNNKDKISKAMVYQWVKTRMRKFLKEESPDGHEPLWLRSCYEQG